MGRVRSMLVIINKMLGVCNRKGGGGGEDSDRNLSHGMDSFGEGFFVEGFFGGGRRRTVIGVAGLVSEQEM